MRHLIRIRRFESKDTSQVQRIWTLGFLDLCSDSTFSLGPIILGPEKKLYLPRPALAVVALAGIPLILFTKSKKIGFACLSLGFIGLFAIHHFTHMAISTMCTDACTNGDMCDIAKSWQQENISEFFVAEDEKGDIVGSGIIPISFPIPQPFLTF